MKIFIISWAGQHENAVNIAKQLNSISGDVSIVYSDPNDVLVLDAPCHLIKRPNTLFWGDKFKACLDATGDGDLLVIHADCTYPNWAELVSKCSGTVKAMPIIGVWSPQIDWVGWTMKMVYIASAGKSPLNIVARTDGIVFYLNKRIVKRMQRAVYDENVFGRGIELLFVSAAYAMGMIAVIDTSILVSHPKATGYSEKEAHHQFINFLKQFTVGEQVQRLLLKSHMMKNGGRPLIPK